MTKIIREIAREIFGEEEATEVKAGMDVIGDIAVIKVASEKAMERRFEIGEALLKRLKNINVVLAQVSKISGPYRLRKLEHLAGEERTQTIYTEYGCKIKVDLAKVYFSPRLSYERFRIASLVQGKEETIVNAFAGCGTFSFLIAKYSKSIVYSIDINKDAILLMQESIKLNPKLKGKVIPILGDAKQVIESELKGMASRVLLPLPELAYDYLPYALMAIRSEGWIHYYDHIPGPEPIEKAKIKVVKRLKELESKPSIQFARVVRQVGPNYFQVVVDAFVS